MKKLSIAIVVMASLFQLGCGGGSSEADNLPENLTVSVSLPENFEVTPGEEFEIEANGSSIPYHPSVELTYRWTKTIYFKPFAEIVADHGGSVFRALGSLETEVDFSTESKIKEISPSLYPGGYVQYNVRIGAKGYIFDTSSFDSSSLNPTLSAYSDNIQVFVVE